MAKEDNWKIWRLGAKRGSQYASTVLGEPISEKEVETHLQNHKTEQPPYEKRSRKECLQAVERLSATEQQLLQLLYRFPALDLGALSLLFYDRGDTSVAWRAAGKATYKMLREEIIYRVYLRYLPGPGPRPKPDPGALYFPGGASRPWREEQTQAKVKRSEWTKGRDDFRDWQQPWELWKDAHSLRSFLQITEPVESGKRSLGPFYLQAKNIWSGHNLPKKILDPVLGTFRIRPQALIGLDYELQSFPVIMWSDSISKKADLTVRDAYRSAGLYRSGILQNLNPNFALPTALIWTDGVGRTEELKRAAVKWRSGAIRVLAADKDTALARPDAPVWRDLAGGAPMSLQDALKRNIPQEEIQG